MPVNLLTKPVAVKRIDEYKPRKSGGDSNLKNALEENAKLINFIKDVNQIERTRINEEKIKMIEAEEILNRAKQIEAEAIRKSEIADQLLEKVNKLEEEIKKNSLKKPKTTLPRVALLSKKK